MNEEFNNGMYDEDINGESAIINLVLDDDSEMQCVVIAVFPVAGLDTEYIALLPISEDMDEEESEVLLYRYAEDADGELQLDNIETDDEYDKVAECFYTIVEDMANEEE